MYLYRCGTGVTAFVCGLLPCFTIPLIVGFRYVHVHISLCGLYIHTNTNMIYMHVYINIYIYIYIYKWLCRLASQLPYVALYI